MRLIFLLFFSTFSVLSSAGTTQSAKVSSLNVEGGDAYIKLNPTMVSDFCGTSAESSSILKLEKNSEGFEEMYSLVLAAYMSGQNVRLSFNSCASSPWGASQVVKVNSAQLGQQ